MDARKCKHCGSVLEPQALGAGGDELPLGEVIERLKEAVRSDSQADFDALLAQRPSPAALQAVRDYADLYGRAAMLAALDRYMARA